MRCRQAALVWPYFGYLHAKVLFTFTTLSSDVGLALNSSQPITFKIRFYYRIFCLQKSSSQKLMLGWSDCFEYVYQNIPSLNTNINIVHTYKCKSSNSKLYSLILCETIFFILFKALNSK